MPELVVDHVTFAGPDLQVLRDQFRQAGLSSEYGGTHSGGVTHMAILGLLDESYIELISTVEPGRRDTPFWPEAITGGAGPCAWAVRSGDLDGDVQRLRQDGIPVEGPVEMHRERGGQLIRWRLAFPGDHAPGAVLPFLIEDLTPRRDRVQASDWVVELQERGATLHGIASTVVGIPAGERDQWVEAFRSAWGLEPAGRVDCPEQDADWEPLLPRDSNTDLQRGLTGAAVVIATPRPGGWLARRMERFGPSPCAFLMSVSSSGNAGDFLKLNPTANEALPVSWVDPDCTGGPQLGVLLRPAGPDDH